MDSFYVLEGELGVTIEGEEHLLGAGACACLPAGVVHAFRSTAPARFLNIHTPDGGFAGNLRALDRGDPGGFDSVDVPAGRGGSDRRAIVLRPGRAAVERDELSLHEQVLEPGFEEPERAHERRVNAWYVLDGEVVLRTRDGTHRLETGSFVAVPPGTVHALAAGREPGRVLAIRAPRLDARVADHA